MARTRITQLHKPHLGRDLFIIIASVLVAIYMARNDIITHFIGVVGFYPIEAFFAGVFFTSLLTITPAGVAFAEMATVVPPVYLALWGAAGAVVGDLILFLFVRDSISQDLMSLLRGPWMRKIRALFKSPFLSWAVPLCGALVIASPLPDEIGLAMLGLSKTDLRFLIPISYAMNFLGILFIAWAVQAV